MTEAAQFENTMSPASSICSTAGTTSDGCGSTLENGFHRRQSLRNGKDAMKSVASVESSESATTLHHVRNMIRQAARRHVECRCKCAVENRRLSSLVERLQVVLKRQKEELIAMQRNVDERLGMKGTSVRHAQLQVNFNVAQQQAEASSKTTTTTTTLISICSNDLEQNSQYPPILDREVMTKETITPAESLNDRLTIPPESAPPKRQKAVKTMRCKPQAAAVPQASCTTQQKPAPAPPAPVQNVNPVVQSRRLSEVHDASNGASVSAPTSYLYNNDRLSFPTSIHASTMMSMGNTEPLNGVSYRIRSPATRPSLPANAINGLAKEFVTFVSHSPPTVAGGCLGSAKRKTDPMAPLHEVPLSKLSRSANSSSPYMPNSLVLEADDIITLDDDEDDDDDGDDDDDEDDKDNNRWSSNVVLRPRRT
uniref:Uncharacterized protein n=1 Tax=Plectus sambesii TaxID=2011161 RepID=A0A914XHK5_9BILA